MPIVVAPSAGRDHLLGTEDTAVQRPHAGVPLGSVQVDEEHFAEMVAAALAALPLALAGRMGNLSVTIADRDPHEPDLLGLYEGVPLTDQHDEGFAGGLAPMPAMVTIYRLAICDACASLEEVAHEVYVTVLHEVAHHFGVDDDRLDELGWA